MHSRSLGSSARGPMSTKNDHEHVRKILADQFEAAVKRRDIASAHFDEVRKDLPSGLPHPDGTQRIAKASSDYVAALREVGRAVQRIADFQSRGIVPEDLKHENNGGSAWPYQEK